MRRNSLFQIDPDEIDARLRSVNAPLLDQADALLDQARQTWKTGDADRMRRDVERLGRLSEDIRRIRLSDTAPLRAAALAGKRVFGEFEASLSRARSALRLRISALESPVTVLASPAPAKADGSGSAEDVPPDAEIAIEDFDREDLPLEALRPYLTDHALKIALTKHLSAHGPSLGPAVRYRELAKV